MPSSVAEEQSVGKYSTFPDGTDVLCPLCAGNPTFSRSRLLTYFFTVGRERCNQTDVTFFFFSQQGNILFMIYMNDESSESLCADGHTQIYICLP